jgi:hypothetical protein
VRELREGGIHLVNGGKDANELHDGLFCRFPAAGFLLPESAPPPKPPRSRCSRVRAYAQSTVGAPHPLLDGILDGRALGLFNRHGAGGWALSYQPAQPQLHPLPRSYHDDGKPPQPSTLLHTRTQPPSAVGERELQQEMVAKGAHLASGASASRVGVWFLVANDRIRRRGSLVVAFFSLSLSLCLSVSLLLGDTTTGAVAVCWPVSPAGGKEGEEGPWGLRAFGALWGG